MAYQALYRRFRPKTFDEVLGQEHVTTILKNQLKNNNIAHAYLFSGTRGTGKTSTSKIFARAVNCESTIDGNPCNECEVCKGIIDNSIMDVVEMDAASNNSVDDIRELKEKVKYLPSKGKYKVYIIDEVHMLSKGAFNALLKTLEEPPKHLIFILATTEPQKLPATILSRCQRFDFKRLTVNDLMENMKMICTELKIDIEERALNLIARNAEGAMRDAQSMLDQCVSFGDDSITYDYVLSILGIVNNDIIFEIVDNIIDKNIDKSLKLIDYIVQNGKDIHQFIIDLINHFRNIMVLKVAQTHEGIIDGTEETINRYKIQAEKLKSREITKIISMLSEAENSVKWSTQPRVILEINLVKIQSPTMDYSVDSLIERIEKLESIIKNGVEISVNKEPKEKVKEDKVQNSIKSEVKNKELMDKQLKESEESNTVIGSNINFDKLNNHWPDILRSIKKKKISIHALLGEGELSSFNNNILTIVFKNGFEFHRDAVDKADNKEFIEKTISTYLGNDIKIKFILENEINNNNSIEEKDINLINRVKEVFGDSVLEVGE